MEGEGQWMEGQGMGAVQVGNKTYPSSLSAGQQLVFPANHCSLMNFTVPQLTKVHAVRSCVCLCKRSDGCTLTLQLWRAYTLTVTSCPPLRGGVVTPWYPHTPLLHNSTSTHLTLPLSLQVWCSRPKRWCNSSIPSISTQVPAPPNAAPHVLIWAPHNCQVQVSLVVYEQYAWLIPRSAWE